MKVEITLKPKALERARAALITRGILKSWDAHEFFGPAFEGVVECDGRLNQSFLRVKLVDGTAYLYPRKSIARLKITPDE